jgi:hypothetical protein
MYLMPSPVLPFSHGDQTETCRGFVCLFDLSPHFVDLLLAELSVLLIILLRET